MGKFIDVTGKRFGKLVVIEKTEKPKNQKKNQTYWLCKCDCGETKIVSASILNFGGVKTCGKCFKGDDLSGKKYGMLTVRELHHYDNAREQTYWICDCACGNEFITTAQYLKMGYRKSCGCNSHPLRLPYGQAAFNSLYRTYKTSAKNRGLEFCLDKDFFSTITKQNCFYCGCPPKQIRYQKQNNGHYIYNGIDRIDSSKGYTEDNVVSCCGQCNVAKMAVPQQEFLSWIERVYNHSIKKDSENDSNSNR